MLEKLLKTVEVVNTYIEDIEKLIKKKDTSVFETILPNILNANFEYLDRASRIINNVKGKGHIDQLHKILDDSLNILINLYKLYDRFHNKSIKIKSSEGTKIFKIPKVEFDKNFYLIFLGFQVLKDHDKALIVLNKIEQTLPNYKKAYEAYYQLTLSCYKSKDYQKALEFVDISLAKNKNYDRANYCKAKILCEMGNFAESSMYVEKALKINPKLPEAYNIKGLLYYYSFEYKKAVECFEKSIELDSKFADPHHNKGFCLRHLGDYDQALFYHQKAIEINPSWHAPYTSIGNIYFLQNNMFKAEEFFKKSEELNKKHPDSYFNLANIFCIRQEYDKAIEYYKKSLSLNLKSIEQAYLRIGEILSLQNKHEKAIEYLEKAISIKPENKYTQYYLGCAHLKTNNNEKALEYLKLASDQNLAEAQFELGLFYLDGTSVPRNQKKAIKLFNKAKNQDHTASKDILNILNVTLNKTNSKIDMLKQESNKEEADTLSSESKSDIEFDINQFKKIIEEERSKSLNKRLKYKIRKSLTQSEKPKTISNVLDDMFEKFTDITHLSNSKSIIKVKIDYDSPEIKKLKESDPHSLKKLETVLHNGKFARAVSGSNGIKYKGKNSIKLKDCSLDVRLEGDIIKKNGYRYSVLSRVTNHIDRHRS